MGQYKEHLVVMLTCNTGSTVLWCACFGVDKLLIVGTLPLYQSWHKSGSCLSKAMETASTLSVDAWKCVCVCVCARKGHLARQLAALLCTTAAATEVCFGTSQ